MCSLCGVLGGRGHWTESDSTPAAFAGQAGATTRRAERQRRTRLAGAVLRHYGMTLSDWNGSAYLLSTLTGRTALVDNLTELWATAEELAGRPCDPLDPGLLAALDGVGR